MEIKIINVSILQRALHREVARARVCVRGRARVCARCAGVRREVIGPIQGQCSASARLVLIVGDYFRLADRWGTGVSTYVLLTFANFQIQMTSLTSCSVRMKTSI